MLLYTNKKNSLCSFVDWRDQTFMMTTGNERYRVIGIVEKDTRERTLYAPVPIKSQKNLRAFLRGSRKGFNPYSSAKISFDSEPQEPRKIRNERSSLPGRLSLKVNFNRDTQSFESKIISK